MKQLKIRLEFELSEAEEATVFMDDLLKAMDHWQTPALDKCTCVSNIKRLTPKEKRAILRAFEVLIDHEQDTVAYGDLIDKVIK